MAGAINYKSEAVKLFQQGNGGRPSHRLLVAMAGQNGVENRPYDAGGPPSRQLVAKWHQQYEAAKEAAEAAARADAAFAANPAPLRSIPGGARADEPAETVEAWSARVIERAVRESGTACLSVLPRLRKVALGEVEGSTVEIAAGRELREQYQMWLAIQQGRSLEAADGSAEAGAPFVFRYGDAADADDALEQIDEAANAQASAGPGVA